MKCYNYEKSTGFFINESEADVDPLLEGNWLFPAFSCEDAPPKTVFGEIARRIGEKWVVEVDYSTRPSKAHDWNAKNKQWVENTERAKQLAIEAAKAAIPKSVTMRQARLALLQAGLLNQINQAMQSPDTPQQFKIEWEYASEVRRDWAGLQAMQHIFELDDDALDALFIAAAHL